MSVPRDGDDYTWETPERVHDFIQSNPLRDASEHVGLHDTSGPPYPYDTRTCAERHGEQLAELGARVDRIGSLLTHCMTADLIMKLFLEDREQIDELRAVIDAQGATIAELKAALLRLGDQVLELARTVEQWRGEL